MQWEVFSGKSMGIFNRQQELSSGGSSGTAQVVERCQQLGCISLKSGRVQFCLGMRLVFCFFKNHRGKNMWIRMGMKMGISPKKIGFFPRKAGHFPVDCEGSVDSWWNTLPVNFWWFILDRMNQPRVGPDPQEFRLLVLLFEKIVGFLSTHCNRTSMGANILAGFEQQKICVGVIWLSGWEHTPLRKSVPQGTFQPAIVLWWYGCFQK